MFVEPDNKGLKIVCITFTLFYWQRISGFKIFKNRIDNFCVFVNLAGCEFCKNLIAFFQKIKSRNFILFTGRFRGNKIKGGGIPYKT